VRRLHHHQANYVDNPQPIAAGLSPDRLEKMLKERLRSTMEITILISRPEPSTRML
jgi:hypothetical protein